MTTYTRLEGFHIRNRFLPVVADAILAGTHICDPLETAALAEALAAAAAEVAAAKRQDQRDTKRMTRYSAALEAVKARYEAAQDALSMALPTEALAKGSAEQQAINDAWRSLKKAKEAAFHAVHEQFSDS